MNDPSTSPTRKKRSILIRDYRPQDRAAFEALNRWWLEKWFAVEPYDAALFAAPEEKILLPGGAIYMAELDGEVAGTCSLVRMPEEEELAYELSKMGVFEPYSGLGIGRALTQHAIADAWRRGAGRVVIYSNTRLEAAIALYRSVGFTEVVMSNADKAKYRRGNIKLVLVL